MIPYSLICPGDVIGVENTFNPFDMVEKTTIRGLRYIFDKNTACHIAIACDRGAGLLYGCAMDYPRINMENLTEYDHDKNGSHIVFIGRHPALDDPLVRINCNDWLLKTYATHRAYGVAKVLEFWGYKDPNYQKDWDCSDLPCELWKANNIQYPHAWDIKVAPFQEQIWTGLIHIYQP